MSDGDPVFLLATERSGSNLVRSILGTHSEIAAPHPFETSFPGFPEHIDVPARLDDETLYKLVRDILIQKEFSIHPLDAPIDVGDVHERVTAIERPTYLDIQEAIYDQYVDRAEKRRWVSKHDGLFYCLDAVLDHYGDDRTPRFVHLVRDPRDVVLSFKSVTTSDYHPFYNARKWREEQRMAMELHEESPDLTRVVRYEDLLQEPRETVEDLCDFLDVDFEEEMLYYYDTEASRDTAQESHMFENISSPIKSDNYGKFHEQLPDEEVVLTEKISLDELVHFGYEPTRSEQEVEEFELREDHYARENDRMTRSHRRKMWKQEPREMLAIYAYLKFGIYMLARYLVLGGPAEADEYIE